MKMAYIIAFI